MNQISDLINSAREAGELSAQVNLNILSLDLNEKLESLWVLCRDPELDSRLQEAVRFHYRGAVPYETPVNKKAQPSEMPLECIGIDGSQVYPEPNHPVLFGWVRALAYQSGPGVIFSLAKCVTQALWDLDDDSQKEFVDLARSLLEISVAQNLTSNPENQGKVVLLDGGLFPWISSPYRSRRHKKEMMTQYCHELSLCYPHYMAAVTQNPRSRALVNLLNLLETKDLGHYVPAHSGLFDRDLVLFFLESEERTALFSNAPSFNNAFTEKLMGSFFFYTRVKNEILRVEVPEWIAQDQKKVNQVHASVIKDSSFLGMPYTLAQAHQHVVVKLDMVEAVRAELNTAYFNARGRPSYPSTKVLIKKFQISHRKEIGS